MHTPSVTADDLHRHSTLGIALGVVIAALGAWLIAFPLLAATATTLVVGGALAVAGGAHVGHALHTRSRGLALLGALGGVLYVLGGLWLVMFPLAGIVALTMLLGILLLLQSVIATATAFSARPEPIWGWFLFDALVTLVLGVSILGGWPWSSTWAIGTLVGVAVLFGGITRVMVSFVARIPAIVRETATAGV